MQQSIYSPQANLMVNSNYNNNIGGSTFRSTDQSMISSRTQPNFKIEGLEGSSSAISD